MKRLIVIVLTIILFSFSVSAQTKFVFSVKPGSKINSALVGIYQRGFLPFIGLDMFWASATVDYEDADETFPTVNTRSLEVLSVNYNGSAFLIVPHVGLKYSRNIQPVTPYIFGSVFVSFPLVNLEADGNRETWEYENNTLIQHETNDVVLNLSEIKHTAREALGFWGLNLGAGAEYFFHPQFSIGGEYGVRILFDTAQYKQINKDYSYDDYPSEKFQNEWRTEVDASLKLSYVVMTLAFYF